MNNGPLMRFLSGAGAIVFFVCSLAITSDTIWNVSCALACGYLVRKTFEPYWTVNVTVTHEPTEEEYEKAILADMEKDGPPNGVQKWKS